MYILTLDPTRHGLVDAERAERGQINAHRIPREAIEAGLSCPHIGVASMPYYSDRRLLAKVTCVQMTATKLFLVWDAAHAPGTAEEAGAGPVAGPSTGPGTQEGVGEAEEEAEAEAEEAAVTMDAPTGDDVWDAPGIDDTEGVAGEGPVAGPSTSTTTNDETAQPDGELLNDNDDNELENEGGDEEEEEDDQDGIDDPVVPLLLGARHERE